LRKFIAPDGRRFQQATGFTPLFSLEDVFASVRH